MRTLTLILAVAIALVGAAPVSALRDPSLDTPDQPSEGIPRLTCYVGIGYTDPRAVGCPSDTTDATYFDGGREMIKFLETGVVTDVTAMPNNDVCYPVARECAADATGWTYPDEAGNYVWEYVRGGERRLFRHPVGTPLTP